MSNSSDEGQRENAYRIFATTPGIIETQHEDTVLSAFTKGFKDESVNVRLSALEAFASFFRTISKKQQQKYYNLIPEVLSVLPPIKESQDSEDLTKALVSLIDLAEVAPKMFKPLFRNLVAFSISVVQDKDLSDQARQNALELMATFADYAPAMCRKDESYTSDMITQCLSLMTDIGIDDDDAQEWNASDDMDPEESDLNHVAGEQCMDRLANKLGGGTILAPTFSWLPRMMTSNSWRDRHAALMAISAISEGCRDLMVGELDKVLELVVPALRDPHSRVRWAGCNALGQMSTDFAGTMQEKYNAVVLPAIIPVLESAEPRVQAHAAAALVNFCEEAEKEVLAPYLDGLLSHLFQLLQSPKRYVQEQALSTIATIADSAETHFATYYSTLMPLLFNVLQTENTKELRLLRAKAMECATLIALAVGKERLGQDAITLVQLLATIQENITDSDDPQYQYLMHCWGRMCRVLGKDFLPYLSGVMGPLLEMAKAKADIQLLDDEEQVEAIQQEEGWELVPLKGKVIGIKTSSLDDKNMAIELLVVYAQVLEEDFAIYVPSIMSDIAIPGLAFFFHDPVRVCSSKLVPQLLNSYKKRYGDSNELASLWAGTVEKVIEVLSAEPAIDTLAEMYRAWYECIEVMGKNCLNINQMQAFITAAQSALQDYVERVKARAEEAAENNVEEGDEESEEVLYAIEDDQQLLSEMNKSFHVIFKHHGVDFLPAWNILNSVYAQFLNSADPTQRQWGLCIIDDVMEFCAERSWEYNNLIIDPLAAGCRDPSPANRQAAAYGVGVAAQRGGPNWTQFCGAAVPLLFDIVNMPDARNDDNIFATENACAAIAKILHSNSGHVQNVDAVIQRWFNETLPIINDDEAAPFAYAYLAELIDRYVFMQHSAEMLAYGPRITLTRTSQYPAVVSQPGRVFQVVAEAFEAEMLAGHVCQRVTTSVKALLQATGHNPDAQLAALTPEGQQAVRAYFA